MRPRVFNSSARILPSVLREMNPLLLTTILFIGLCGTTLATRSCNGMTGLCDLRFDQVTLPCTHNSASNRQMFFFDGWHGSYPADSCYYRNQGKQMQAQLDWGIRFFDIDTKSKKGKPYTSHGDALGKDLDYEIGQITSWMNQASHRNEVIGIRFENTQMNGEFSKFADVFRKHGWLSSGTSGVRVNNQGRWPTLNQAIDANQRIFVFVHPDLCSSSCRSTYPWANSNYHFDDSWKTRAVSSSCSGIVSETRDMCRGKSSTFMLVSIFASYGLCINHMQGYCNPYIRSAANACYNEREKRGKTINWVCADYVGNAGSNNNVKIVSNEINVKNIERFSNK